jgi:2-methylcitrate dehydratase PrpD
VNESPSRTLARFVVQTQYDDLPVTAREKAKRCLLDALGVSLAATGLADECRAFQEYAVEQGGRPDCTLLGSSQRAPAALAALANGALAHALDFEDSHDRALLHPNAPTVPVVLALSEAFGPVSGRDAITALVLGCEVACRIALALNVSLDRYGWYPPPIIAAFGATAAAGKLLGLDETQLIDAFSLTLCQATCSAELKSSPHSHIRAVRDAFPAQIAVTAALLARKGVRGFERPFEGRAGFFSLYARGEYSSEALVARLGERCEIEGVSFKPWPSCRGTHVFIEAARTLAREHAIDAETIASIELEGSRLNRMLAEPVEQKRRPATAIDAKFSLPFTVALAMHHGEVALDHFLPDALRDRRTLALASRVSYAASESQPDQGIEALRGRVTIRTGAGAAHSLEIAQPLGSELRPLTDDALIAKFIDCCSRASSSLARQRAASLARQVLMLEDCDALGPWVRELSAGNRVSGSP